MAIVYPGADYRQLPGKSKVALAPRIINVHTMVGGLDGVERYFGTAGNPYSHFGTGGGGEVRQWQDLAFRAASDLYGNPYCISIENADKGSGFPAWTGTDVPRFTDKQADALVMLLSWLCHRFNLPRSAITTSCPHESGIGYHRLGVDPYRNTSCGHKWSSAYGKACPGNRRIAQLLNEIIPRVSTPVPDPEPEDDDMPKPFLCRLSLKSPAVLYVDASRHVHWVRGNAALKGYQLQLRLDKPADGEKAGDVCVLSPNAAEQHIKDLYAMVINLPAIGALPDDHKAVWVGPIIESTAEAVKAIDAAISEEALATAIEGLPEKVAAAVGSGGGGDGGGTADPETIKAGVTAALEEQGLLDLLGLLPGR